MSVGLVFADSVCSCVSSVRHADVAAIGLADGVVRFEIARCQDDSMCEFVCVTWFCSSEYKLYQGKDVGGRIISIYRSACWFWRTVAVVTWRFNSWRLPGGVDRNDEKGLVSGHCGHLCKMLVKFLVCGSLSRILYGEIKLILCVRARGVVKFRALRKKWQCRFVLFQMAYTGTRW